MPPEPTSQQPSEPTDSPRSLKKLLLLCVLGMLVPVIPFVLFGEALEAQIASFITALKSPGWLLIAAASALMIDIFLPVPSSAVITYAGSQCGIVPTTIVSTIGLTIGCGIGFELSQLCGPSILNRFSTPADRTRLHRLAQRWGAYALIMTRPLPILGETAVLILGCLKMLRWRFYATCTVTNAMISGGYASFGFVFNDPVYLPFVIAASLVLPLVATVGISKLLSPRP